MNVEAGQVWELKIDVALAASMYLVLRVEGEMVHVCNLTDLWQGWEELSLFAIPRKGFTWTRLS